MQILDALKIDAADKLGDRSFVEGLDTSDVISKLLVSVYSLENQVGKLKDQLSHYEHLNQLLDLEDVEAAGDAAVVASTTEPVEPPPIVQGITVDSTNDDSKIPIGFTPMYSAPALSDEETQQSHKDDNDRRFVRPWPEVTLNQLASRFKIPRELLSKTAPKSGNSKDMDDSNLKPIRGSDIVEQQDDLYQDKNRPVGRPKKNPAKPHRGPGRPKKSDTPTGSSSSPPLTSRQSPEVKIEPDAGSNQIIDATVLAPSTKRLHDQLFENSIEGPKPSSTSSNGSNGSNGPNGSEVTVEYKEESAKRQRLEQQAVELVKSALKYTITSDLKYSCDTCQQKTGTPQVFDNYMQMYEHKRQAHPEEFVNPMDPRGKPRNSESSSTTTRPVTANSSDVTPESFPSQQNSSSSPPSLQIRFANDIPPRNPSLPTRGRPLGLSNASNSLIAYYTRGPDRSYICSLCHRKPFTSYHGIYAHMRSTHYDPATGTYHPTEGGNDDDDDDDDEGEEEVGDDLAEGETVQDVREAPTTIPTAQSSVFTSVPPTEAKPNIPLPPTTTAPVSQAPATHSSDPEIQRRLQRDLNDVFAE
ncbi:DEKNAAC102445 [Brettanomyces naardenensis]|uniref:DEKNAAC102445 n=1 Tax=Brettanomyces naardenensis TaxID=13370 RepID=A0A448YLH0_BRENA|nr:DEKNAAC102445 [Brettanomyces naardenensis]